MTSDFKSYLDARPIIHRGAVIVFAVCIVVGLSARVATLVYDARKDAQDASTFLERYAATWSSRISARLTEAVSLASCAGSFAAGGATTVPDHDNGTVAQRIQFINNASWAITAAALFAQVPGMLSLQLQPSGIVAQFWPPGSAPLGLDVLYQASTRPGLLQLVQSKVPVANGPVPLAQGGLGVLVRFPVYLNPRKAWQDWWGAGVAVFRISDLLHSFNITSIFAAAGVDFVCFAAPLLANNTAAPTIILQTDRYNNVTQHTGGVMTRLQTSDPINGLFLSVYRREGSPSEHPSAASVVLVVVPVFVGSILMVGLIYAALAISHMVRHRLIPHRTCEPVETPMALVAIQKFGWWMEHQDPEVLHDELVLFEHTVARTASRHGCHCAGRASDGCVIVVGKHVESIRSFALDCRETLTATMAKLARHMDKKTTKSDKATSRGKSGYRVTPRGSQRSGHRRGPTRVETQTETSNTAGDTSVKSSRLSFASTKFEFAIALHVGLLKSAYNAESDVYTYHGAGVSAAAVAVDNTFKREVSATEAFYDQCQSPVPGQITVPRHNDETTVYVIAHDGEAAAKRTSRGNMNEASVATAVSAKAGVVVRKRVAVLTLEILPPPNYDHKCARDPPIAKYSDVLETVVGIARDLNGEICKIHDTQFAIIFNGIVPVSSPARRAVQADHAIRSALRGKRIISAVAHGFCHVTQAAQGCLAIGDAARRSRMLVDELFVHNLRERGTFERTAVVDSQTAEELRQTCEMQCMGALNLTTYDSKATLIYAVEREWPEDHESDEEWLYRHPDQIPKHEAQSPYTPLNGAFVSLMAGNLQTADMYIRDVAQRDARCFDSYALRMLRELTQHPPHVESLEKSNFSPASLGAIQANEPRD
jgi:hypothetical protein